MSKLDKEALESLDSMRELMDNADCLISQEQVERALDRMAEEITRDLGDKLPVFYCVMNGGLITTGHLLTRLGFPLEVDYLHATRYRNELRGGELFWRVSPEIPMAKDNIKCLLTMEMIPCWPSPGQSPSWPSPENVFYYGRLPW